MRVVKRRVVRLALCVGIALSILSPVSGAVGASASAGCPAGWHRQSQPLFNPLLSSVSAMTGPDVWAVGERSFGTYRPLAEHWNGLRWSVVPVPLPPGAYGGLLADVATLPTGQAWAVGFFDVFTPLIEFWDGTSWSLQTPAEGREQFSAVAALSATDAWAVGYHFRAPGNHRETLTEHWDGTAWTVVPSPNSKARNTTLSDVSMASSTDVWAVGSGNLTIHWDGTTWTRFRPGRLGPKQAVELTAVTADSAGHAYAVGWSRDLGRRQPVVETWDGRKWRARALPGPLEREGISVSMIPGTASAWVVVGYISDGDPALVLVGPTSMTTAHIPEGIDHLWGVNVAPSGRAWAVGDAIIRHC
jgi:hypothetical protein